MRLSQFKKERSDDKMVNPIKKTKNTNANKVDKPLSEKEEEILEYIGKLFEKNQDEAIKRLDLADILQCSPALVNKLLNSLEEKELILHRKWGEIRLTKKGVKISNSLIRKHRLSEALFVELLGLEAADSHEFACKFEHIMDDKLADRIEIILNNPTVCPHGNPIPSKKNHKVIITGRPLSSLSINEIVSISQIINENTAFLRKLSQIGIEVGTEIKIIEKSPLDGTLLLDINGKIISLGEDTAKSLLVVSKQDGEA